jgi:hypothetical protein
MHVVAGMATAGFEGNGLARGGYRDRGKADIAQFAGAIGSTHSPLLYLRRRHACGLAVGRRLVPATPPAMFAKQLVIDRSIIRIKSAHKWPEKIVLDTSQPTITPPAVAEPPATQSGCRLTKRETIKSSGLGPVEAGYSVGRCRPSALAHQAGFGRGSLDHSVWPEAPLHVG